MAITAQAANYTAKDIEVLEGLEPVRKRPAMYIGGTDSTGFHHLLWEIVDNSVDEAINGHATTIDVVLDEDLRGATVIDDGRGIPVDIHPKYKRPALELILCTLHAGGKFGGKNYQVAGGLHGVGSSVVNALAESMSATVAREGSIYNQSFARGVPQGKLQKKPGAAKKHGTSIHFRPDPEIFGTKLKFDPELVRERLETIAYLQKGLKIRFVDPANKVDVRFHHPGGVADFLKAIVERRKEAITHPQAFVLERELENVRVQLSLQWTESTQEALASFANGIPTKSGGTHESGLKQAVAKAVRAVLGTRNLVPKGVNVTPDDVREGLVAVLSVYVPEPQFQGQTKDRLNNADVSSSVESAVRPALERWLLENVSTAEAIAARVVLAARAREASRAAVQQVQRKTAVSHRLNLPGKLADCASTDPSQCELFLVEGDSAGGSAKQGRDRRTQAVLPLRGKVLNAERASSGAVISNRELQDIVSALGCGVGQDFDYSKLRYGKIFLLMDADSDGHHIATLLLTFFYRMFPELVNRGHIFLAQPPLYRIDAGKETFWALDDTERDRIMAELGKKRVKPEISRFKGLGEMQAEELKMTTLDPKARRALQVEVGDAQDADRVLTELLGKDVQARYSFIMQHAPSVTADELDV